MKPTVDVIIVADSSREEFRTMTQNCIDTVQKSNPHFDYNIIIVESWDGFGESGHRYEGCKVVVPGVPFNYNLFLQYGIAQGDAEWVALCNNDLLFHPDWFEWIYLTGETWPVSADVSKWHDKGHFPSHEKDYYFHSFSPWCPIVHPHRFPDQQYLYEGKRVAYELTGWCIVTRRSVLEKINLDTRVDFWFSDNIYADELERLGLRHVLVRNSIVTHLGSQTLNTRPRQEWKRLTTGQKVKYK